MSEIPPTLRALVDAAKASPNDTATLGAVADYLEETGARPRTARLFRLACFLSQHESVKAGRYLDAQLGYYPGTLGYVHGRSYSSERAGTAYTAAPPAPGYTGAAPRLTILGLARCVLADFARESPRHRAESVRLKRHAETLAAAQAGDVSTLLANDECRRALAAGGIATLVRKRKVVAQARALLAERESRRAARKIAEQARSDSGANRYRQRYLDELHSRAVHMGERYHRTVKSLYKSKRAEVEYGRGGQEHYDRDAYAKSYHVHNPRTGGSFRPGAAWKNAGARLDSEDRPTCVILENFRGTEVARLPLRPAV